MARKIYLEGGESHKTGIFFGLEKEALSETEDNKIFVLDFARHGEKISRKKIQDTEYFGSMDANILGFATDLDSEGDLINLINESEILYLPGGSTELLLERISEKGLVSTIKSYNKVIIGNSAGAYACCNEYFKIRENEVETIPSLGLVDLSCKAHYREDFDEELMKYSLTKDIYGVPEGSAIIVEDGEKIKFFNEVFLFSKGKKTKAN